MKLVRNNPYRILGLLVGASATIQNRHITRISRYIEAGGEVPDEFTEFTFPALGNLDLTTQSVSDAASKLNLDNDRLNAALFWFYNGNEVTDPPAFEALKDSDIQGAIEIWRKKTSTNEVTQSNSSAFHNLSSLLLCKSINGASIDEKLFEEGLSLKLKFLESDFVKDFKAKATDVTFKTTKKEIQISFLNALQQEVEDYTSISPSNFIEMLLRSTFISRKDFLETLVQNPIDQIEKKIEKAKKKRKSNKENAANAGKELFSTASTDLTLLQNILGPNDRKFITISDKVADEILQCGIDYFFHLKDTTTDPGPASMFLFKKATSLAIGNIVKQRCNENTDNLQEWIDEKPKREKHQKIKSDLDALIQIFQEYEDRSATIQNARSLIVSCKPRLANIKSVLGPKDEFYLKLATRVAAQAQSYIIEEVNKSQQNLNYKLALDRSGTIRSIKSILFDAWLATASLGSLDMEYDFKENRFKKNRESLQGLCTQAGVSIPFGDPEATGRNAIRNPYVSLPDTSNESIIPTWLKWVGAFLLFVLIIRACN